MQEVQTKQDVISNVIFPAHQHSVRGWPYYGRTYVPKCLVCDTRHNVIMRDKNYGHKKQQTNTFSPILIVSIRTS